MGSSPRSGTRLPLGSNRGGKSIVSPESEPVGESSLEWRGSFERLRLRRCPEWRLSSGDEYSSADNSLCTGSMGNLTDFDLDLDCRVGVAAPVEVVVTKPERGEKERPRRGEIERPRGELDRSCGEAERC